ncbi:MAG TPA: efflux transporter outer membrane subunit [Bryobacteraceae bacterium]|nr:efflux transporter outer membrane subunit [Bryobacteraceae bacterium]
MRAREHSVGTAPSRSRLGRWRLACAALLVAASSGCMVGPKYKRPSAPVTPAYKEPPPAQYKEWKQATPMAEVIKGKWWEIYHDPALNALEEHVAISNQNVLMFEAQYREAKAAVKVAHSALFPTLTIGPTATFSSGGGVGVTGSNGTVLGKGGGGSINQLYTVPLDFSWELDVWGALRRGVRAAKDTAQADAALIENAKLSYQAALAEDYFSLHGLDAETKLLEQTVKLYVEYLNLTRDRYSSGIASAADVALAQTQLDTARAQLIGLGVQRTAFEHAIAVLMGRPPAELTIPEVAWNTPPPSVPVGLPSQLLERRPDIAAAERTMAAVNEQIGIAKAAYYPTVTLSGVLGAAALKLGQLFTSPTIFWSVGPQAVGTLLDFGRRRGLLEEAQAAYEAQVASYRQTVLTAFQQVEDNLAALRILQEEQGAEDRAVAAARNSLDLTTEQYQQGLADYLQVITTQTTLYTDELTAVQILTSRMVDNVLLVEALGGGWDASQLPKL